MRGTCSHLLRNRRIVVSDKPPLAARHSRKYQSNAQTDKQFTIPDALPSVHTSGDGGTAIERGAHVTLRRTSFTLLQCPTQTLRLEIEG